MQVLVVKTSSMGDVIHALPAISDARSQLPDIQFDWLVEEGFAEIPSWHPAISQVIPVALRRWRKKPWSSKNWRQLLVMKHSLQQTPYELVIDAQGLVKSALLARIAKAPLLGMDAASCREPLASRFYQHGIAVDRDLHAIERIRHLFAAALNYTFDASSALDYGLHSMHWLGEPNQQPYLLFVHAASAQQKCWETEQWIALAKLVNNAGYRVLLPWGTAEEKQRALAIAKNADDCVVLTRKTLSELVLLFQHATAIVAVDTGLAHLAAALGVPAVTLYWSTLPQRVGTKGLRQRHINATQFAKLDAQCVWDKVRSQLLTIG